MASLLTSPTSQRSRGSSGGIMATSEDDTQGMSGLLAERMAEGGGALCNDENGLCLGTQGNIDASQSGCYTAISKLAKQLDSTVDGSGGNNTTGEVPLISIQTENAALLVKEYGGRTVVFRVPTEAQNNSEGAGDTEATGEGQGGSDEAPDAN